MSECYVLQVKWDNPGLPGILGPFRTVSEAKEWADLNVPNGTWEVSPLAWPHSGGGVQW